MNNFIVKKVSSILPLCSHVINLSDRKLYCFHSTSAQRKAEKRKGKNRKSLMGTTYEISEIQTSEGKKVQEDSRSIRLGDSGVLDPGDTNYNPRTLPINKFPDLWPREQTGDRDFHPQRLLYGFCYRPPCQKGASAVAAPRPPWNGSRVRRYS